MTTAPQPMQLHELPGHMQDMYMAVYADKILLLDGGCRCDVSFITDYISHTLGRQLSDLKLVVVTHHHPDHAGGAHKLRKLTGCNIATANKPTYWYAGMQGFISYAVDIALSHKIISLLKKPQKNLLYNPYIKPDYLLIDGDTLPYFPDWQVIETAGHTDRDLSLFHKETQSVYVADLIIKTKRGYIAPFPVHFPTQYQLSLKKLQTFDINTFYLAHGGKVHINQSELADFINNQAPQLPQTIAHILTRKLKKYCP